MSHQDDKDKGLNLDARKLEEELAEAREEIRLLKAIMDVMKDKANE